MAAASNPAMAASSSASRPRSHCRLSGRSRFSGSPLVLCVIPPSAASMAASRLDGFGGDGACGVWSVRCAGGLTSVSAMGSNPEDGEILRSQSSLASREAAAKRGPGPYQKFRSRSLPPVRTLLQETSMATPVLTDADLDQLRRFNTPTISNAIELFDVRPRHAGFLPHQIRCLLPELGPIVGYAVTSQTRATVPEPGEPKTDLLGDYLRYVAATPGPKIAVGWDRDDPPGLGAQFGEVTATIHQKLGCVGHITSGCPRDLDEVRGLGFALFGLNPCVSHAYVRLVDFGTPVNIAGHRDQNGRLDPRRQARRVLDSARGGAQAGGGVRGSRAPGATAAGKLPVAMIFHWKSTSSSGPSRTRRLTNRINRVRDGAPPGEILPRLVNQGGGLFPGLSYPTRSIFGRSRQRSCPRALHSGPGTDRSEPVP